MTNQEMIATLDKILPVVERVHGDHHPELHEVLALYNKLKESPSAGLYGKLRDITGYYTVPQDACPTYEKTYSLLKALDEAFLG